MSGLSEENQANPFASPRTSPKPESIVGEVETSLSQYAKVRLGLQIIYNSIGTIAGVLVFAIVSTVLLALTLGPIGRGFPQRLFLSAGSVICLILLLVMIVGFCMTLACPRRDERSFATTSVVCFLLSIGICLAGALLIPTSGTVLLVAVSLGASVLSNVSAISFCLLLMRIGRNISSNHLEKRALSMLVWYGIFFATGVTGLVVMLLFSFQMKTASGSGWNSQTASVDWLGTAFIVAMFVLALVVLFNYLAMLRAGTSELKPRTNLR